MLNEHDIEFMRKSRGEILAHRERSIFVIYPEIDRDPITGVILGETEQEREVNAVITEISSAVPDRTVEGGITYYEGDIKADISLAIVEDVLSRIEKIWYDGNDYEVISADKKGIGARNRVEIVGRLIV